MKLDATGCRTLLGDAIKGIGYFRIEYWGLKYWESGDCLFGDWRLDYILQINRFPSLSYVIVVDFDALPPQVVPDGDDLVVSQDWACHTQPLQLCSYFVAAALLFCGRLPV